MWHWPGKSLFKQRFVYFKYTKSHVQQKQRADSSLIYHGNIYFSFIFISSWGKRKNVSWHFRPGCFSHRRILMTDGSRQRPLLNITVLFFLSGHSSVQLWLWFCSTRSCFVTCVDDGTVRLETLISVCKNQLLVDFSWAQVLVHRLSLFFSHLSILIFFIHFSVIFFLSIYCELFFFFVLLCLSGSRQ